MARTLLVLFVAVCLLAFHLKLEAQQSNTFYLMHDVPQSNLLNPAVQISCRYFVGFPVLGSVQLNYSNTAFTYKDLAGSDAWNIQGVERQMHRRDLYTVEAGVVPVALGYRRKAWYFTFHIAERLQAYQIIPGNLAEMAVYGNGSFIGNSAVFNGFRSGAFHIREYALGISWNTDPNLNVGIRAKLMFGKAGLSTGQSRMSLGTAEDNFGLTLNSDYTFNTSFPYTITSDSADNVDGIRFDPAGIDPVAYLLNRGNPGFGLDLGLIYRYSEQVTLSASILDLGIIRWKTELNNITASGEYNYVGADLNAQLGTGAFISEALDSIFSSVDLTTSRDPYSYVLPIQLYLGGSYRYNDKVTFGLVNRNVLYRSKIHSSFTASATADLADRLLGTLSWSYLNNSLVNMGVGIAYHGKGYQLHAVTDNLLGIFFPFNTRTLNLRFGMNLLLGCPKNKKERLLEESFSRLPQGICPYPEKPEKKRRKRILSARKRDR